jgi:hypothetical protein
MNMRSFRIFAPLALGAALVAVAVAPSVASSSADGESTRAEPIVVDRGPVAHAAGGDLPPPPLPAIVNVRVTRTEVALEGAATAVDNGQPAVAVVELNAAVRNMRKATTAAQFVVRTTPPPVAEEDSVDAHASGDPVAGGLTATPEDTVAAVLSLQHDVLTTAMGLTNGADPGLAPAIANAINAAINNRNIVVTYVHSIAPPVAEEDSVDAHASGDPIVATWDTVMAGAAGQVDDEVQQATGTHELVPTSTVNFQNVINRVTATKNRINRFWPPIPVED